MNKNFYRFKLLIFAMLLTTTSSFASDDSWFGIWKLDRSSSRLTGTTLTIVRIPNGYRFDFGATRFDIGDDGRDYPTVSNRTTSLRAVNEHEWLRVHKSEGKEIDHSTVTVSPDGSILRIRTVAVASNGTITTSVDVEKRVGSGSGLAGTWRSTVAGINVSETFKMTKRGSGKLRRDFPEEGQYYELSVDGVPVAYKGPRAVASVTVAMRRVSATELRWTERIDGKTLTEGVDILSADGKMLTETTWPITNPAEKQRAVYRKEP